MSDYERIPISEVPGWVRGIVDQEIVLPEELAEARASGNSVFRAIRAEQGNFLICFDQGSGEPTDIIWL